MTALSHRRGTRAGGRSFGRWVLGILGVVFTILATAYASLLLTSDPVTTHERQILLHEAYHLFDDDEEFALRRVWLVKDRLGWTSLRYGHTRVWKNTREWTAAAVPSMFSCGEDERADCLE